MSHHFPLEKVGSLLASGAIVDVRDGNHGELHPVSEDYVESGIPFIMANDLHGSRLDLICCKFISEERASQLRKGFAIGGDVLLTHKGTIGSTAVVPEVSPYIMLTPQVTYYRVNEGFLHNRFLRFVFMNRRFQVEIRNHIREGTRPYIGITAQRELRVEYPPLMVQHRIADILSAYDDLIENNNRRMALLEESIHLLYREWFVYLRFPGHERLDIVDGVPDGWTRAAGKHAIAFNPRTPIPKDNVRPYVPMGSISTDSMRITDLEERVPKGGAKFRNGDTLLARITPCLENGKTGFVQFMATADEAASGSTEFIVMRGKTVPSSWVYCLARSAEFRQEAINRMSGSDGRQRVDWKALAELDILVPSESIAAEFDEASEDVFRQIHLLNHYGSKLREARDLLLPRLMDGRIPV